MAINFKLGKLRILRPRVALPIAIALFFAFQLHFFNRYQTKGSLTNAIASVSGPSAASNGKKVYYNDKNYVASPYETLVKKHQENIDTLTYHEKCESYFKLLYQTEATWELTDFAELPYERYIFESKNKFIQKKLDEKFREPELNRLPNNERDKLIADNGWRELFEIEWSKVVETSRITEQRLVDASTHLRVYGACFLDQFGKFNKMQSSSASNSLKVIDDQCYDIEIRMFQWLSRRLPTYKRWDGQVFNVMPKIADYIEQSDIDDYKGSTHYAGMNGCYLKDLRDSFNGRGITISAASKHMDQLINLFGVLRSTGNKLPIQIVHSGDLDEVTQQKIIALARVTKGLKLNHVDNLEFVLKHKNLTYDADDEESVTSGYIEELFPKQEVWFVDVSQAISPKYREKFGGYANKLLAYFFNSFQHSILIDTDTVPVVDLDKYILGSSFYKEKGAYFFKDRELQKQNSESDEILYTKLMPSKMDNVLFGIPEVTDFTLKNRFIGERFAHLMESGVVAIDKIKHFTGVLATIQILMWGPAASKVWGDKELFWLGMSMAGDEDYFLNHWPAGAAGQITPRARRLRGDKDDSRRSKIIGNELCSTHPAHVSSEDNSTLLWFNSGFTFCKFLSAADEDLRFPLLNGLFNDPKELRTMYESYHKIDSVIVPKPAEYFVDGGKKGENSRGWEKMDVCRGFIWCAYDKVGGLDVEEGNGLLINIDATTQKLYDFYGSVSQYASEIFGVTLD